MKAQIKVDRRNRQIVLNSGFSKRADFYNTQEYEMLRLCRLDYPDYEVITRTIKRNPSKETYSGLTYSYMEKYIRLHSSTPDELRANLEEFSELKLISECHSKARKYPAIKRWFLNKYPEIAQFGLIDLEQKTPLLPYSNTVALPEPEVA